VSWHCGSFRASRVMYTFAVCNCGAIIRTLIAITPTLIVRGYPYPDRDYPYPYRDYPYPYRDYPYPYRDYPYPYRARLSVPLFRSGYGALAVNCGTAAALRVRRRRRQRTVYVYMRISHTSVTINRSVRACVQRACLCSHFGLSRTHTPTRRKRQRQKANGAAAGREGMR
jgi:hypothetical protein